MTAFNSKIVLGSTLSLFALMQYANAEGLPFILNAEEISYEKDSTAITAGGDVELISEEGSLKADEISYDQVENIISATGNILFKGLKEKSINKKLRKTLSRVVTYKKFIVGGVVVIGFVKHFSTKPEN